MRVPAGPEPAIEPGAPGRPPPSARDHAATLRAGAWFAALPSALQQRLLDLARLRTLACGQRLFAKGEAADGLYGVVRGAIRVTTLHESGKEAILAIIEPPHWFGEIALFDGQPRTHDAWAESDATLLHLPQPALLHLLGEQPAAWHAFGLLLAHKLRMSFSAMEEAALLPPAGRLARRLLAMAQGFGAPRGPAQRLVRVPQEQLGLMLSMSRQTVNQLLRQLQADGAIALGRAVIEIRDPRRLRSLGGLPQQATRPEAD